MDFNFPIKHHIDTPYSTGTQPRILFVSIYPELTEEVKELSRQMQIPIDILEGGIHKNGHLYAEEHQDRYDVVISQAGTAHSIQQRISKPVIAIQLTVRDYLEAFHDAGQYNKQIVLIGHKGESQKDLDALFRNIFQGTARSYSYECREDFNSIVEGVMNFGKEQVIIGFGGCIGEYAASLGIPYVLIKSRQRHIAEALLAGKNIVDLHAKNKIRSRRLHSILNYSREGIIAVDGEARITMCNIATKRMLKLRGQHLTQMDLTANTTPFPLRRLYGDGSFTHNELMLLDDKKYLVSRVPIHWHAEKRETVITFQDLAYIQKEEAKARAKLGAKGLFAKYHFNDIVAADPDMQKTIAQAKKFASTAASILIEAETGTGKELFAQSIHNASKRKHGPFVAINCAALPENLLESELFGYDEGAFTGAKKGGKLGLFEMAHNGTIFLDEIGETSLNIQGRLLRVLQEKEIMRVGGDKVINVDTRIIAATNKKLYQMVQDGKFRNDLYFRLNLLNLELPPLRTRKKDIAHLTEHFCQIYAAQYKKPAQKPGDGVMAALAAYPWPGNVRELENCIERSIILTDEHNTLDDCIKMSLDILRANHTDGLADHLSSTNTIQLELADMASMQEAIIEHMLEIHDGNKSKVADELGISRVTVWKKAKCQTT